MGLVVINAADPDLNVVQERVKQELDKLEAAQPSTKEPNAYTTVDYTVKLSDSVVLANPLTSLNVYLPAAKAASGLRFTVKNASKAGTVHVRPRYSTTAPELIDNATRLDLAAGAKAALFSDGANWWVL